MQTDLACMCYVHNKGGKRNPYIEVYIKACVFNLQMPFTIQQNFMNNVKHSNKILLNFFLKANTIKYLRNYTLLKCFLNYEDSNCASVCVCVCLCIYVGPYKFYLINI